MISIAFAILATAAVLFVARLLLGPTVPDRVVATDGLLTTVMCGVLVAAASQTASVNIDTVLVVALLAFIATAVLARYVERRADEGSRS